jgi:mxaJ protein
LRLLPSLALALWSAQTFGSQPLTVCADPNNLPFSNRDGAGFENRLAELIARDLDRQLRYVWWAQRRGFARHTLSEDRCDLWPGVASGIERMATTRPYYRSSYMFVTRTADQLTGLTLDDARLASLRIGVQMVGNDAMNTPPAHALARRHLTQNVRGYMLYGDYRLPDPPAAIVNAVSRGDVDVALVWGPLAGYFAARSQVPLSLEPVRPAVDEDTWPMSYSISVGVRREDLALRDRINQVLDRESLRIAALLKQYHVPDLTRPTPTRRGHAG